MTVYNQDYEVIKKIFENVYAYKVKKKDLKGYGEMYTEDALWIAPNVPDRQGKADIIEGFKATIANQDIDPVFTAEEIKVIDDFGYVIGTSIAKISPHDGSPTKEVIFRALWLMKKEQKQWKIDRQIWNVKPAKTMNENTFSKEQYREIIEVYFRAFDTKDFAPVKFSPNIQFLSPISERTMDGIEDVTRFVSNVSTRVSEVNILSITVDYPTASGVWQMRTTQGILYTLHNFFRLDEEGLVYIWPMFDPKAIVDNPDRLVPWLTGNGY